MLKIPDIIERFHTWRAKHISTKAFIDLMYMPEYWISPHDSMDEVVEKFENSGRFNLAVINNGKYMGFISRASVFTNYRKHVKHFSND